MTESEILFPVKCPVCLQESLTGFRISVVAEALQTLQIRLYANCHVASWDASEAELAQLGQYLDAAWTEDLPEVCQEYSINSVQGDDSIEFIYTGVLEDIESGDCFLESSHS
jgi:hypothetical protein